MISTSLFSKPSSRSFENGRLLRSAHTRSSHADAGAPTAHSHKKSSAALRQLEDIERSSLRRGLLEICHGIDEAERRGAVAWIEIARDNGAGPAADAGQHGHVLMAVGPAIGHRLADDPRGGLELPQDLTGFGVNGFKPALHRAVEHDISGCRHDAAPDREVLL